jgi:hypothetical protein
MVTVQLLAEYYTTLPFPRKVGGSGPVIVREIGRRSAAQAGGDELDRADSGFGITNT